MLRVSSDQSRGWRTLLPRVGHATLSSRLPHAHRRLDVAVRTSRPQSQLATPGRQLHGFVVRRKKDIPELQLTAIQLLHERTGAEYIHIARDDKNNVFSIGFKTNPPDSTGVPHILEHTTLCGSKKYTGRPSLRQVSRLTRDQVSRSRPFLQNDASLACQLHECIHRTRLHDVSVCDDKPPGLQEFDVRISRCYFASFARRE